MWPHSVKINFFSVENNAVLISVLISRVSQLYRSAFYNLDWNLWKRYYIFVARDVVSARVVWNNIPIRGNMYIVIKPFVDRCTQTQFPLLLGAGACKKSHTLALLILDENGKVITAETRSARCRNVRLLLSLRFSDSTCVIDTRNVEMRL